MPDAVDTVVCASDDGWRYHPKHVEQFPDINKLCNVAACWIYIGIYLRCTDTRTLNRNNHESKVTVLWNQQVQTNRTISNNKPDIIMRDNEIRKRCVAISAD
jgi:hypothetical protein